MDDRPAGRPVRRRRLRQPQRSHRGRGRQELHLTRSASLLVALLLAAPAGAQEISFWLDATTSHAQPPAGVTGDAALYALVGTRLDMDFDRGGLAVQGRVGGALTGTAGRWIQGTGTVVAGRALGRLGVRAAVSGFGLRYLDPFVYEAGGVEVQPTLALPFEGFVLTALPLVSAGGWAADSVDGDLRITGGDLELRRSMGPVTVGVSGGALEVENGTLAGSFWRGGGTVTVDRPLWTLALEIRTQRTPLEDEVGGGASVRMVIAPGVELRVDGARSLRDPLFGTPGSVVVSAGVGVRPFRWTAPTPPPLVAIGERRNGGREVRFTLRAPEAAEVALVGDFTAWEPVQMEQEDGRWRVTRVLPPGVHHFGFTVDGQWAIPPDAPGIVDDGWGRRNASIVVQP